MESLEDKDNMLPSIPSLPETRVLSAYSVVWGTAGILKSSLLKGAARQRNN